MTRDLTDDYELCAGPQKREPDEPETWQRYLDEKCPTPEPQA